jgi:hypothetical protein
MQRRILLLLVAIAGAGFAQKYDGPRPEKPDLPYLKHADNLIPTEAAEAKEEKHKDDTLYIVEGASSPAKTPLPSPVFLFQSDKIQPEKLALYKLETTKTGRREILFSPKKKQNAVPIRIEVKRLSSDNLYRIEVDDTLSNGEYSLSPEGSNQVFCFQVY